MNLVIFYQPLSVRFKDMNRLSLPFLYIGTVKCLCDIFVNSHDLEINE